MEEIILNIISHAGNARTSCMNAMKCLKTFDFEGCEALLASASQDLKKAHLVQTKLIQEEVKGNTQTITLLMVHAQDHLMNTLTLRDTVTEMLAFNRMLDARLKVLETKHEVTMK